MLCGSNSALIEKKSKFPWNEENFHLGDYVKENCLIWGSENPHVIVEKPIHPESDSLVWISERWIIGQFLFENVADPDN